MIKINNFINKHIMLIFTIFLFLQPVLDVLTGVMLYLFNVTFTFSSVVRMLFLLIAIYYLIINDKNAFKPLIIIFLYSILFMLGNIIFKNNYNIVLELKYLLNNIYLPVLILFVFRINKVKKFNIKYIFIILSVYLILVFIPNIFNIGFDSYAYSKEGSVGFFYSANAVGSIISILSPIFICYLITNKKIFYLILFLLIYIYILLTLGTKAPILCFGIILIYYLILFITYLIKNKKYLYIIVSFILFFIFLIFIIKFIPTTPFYKNLIIHLDFLNIKKFTDLLTLKNIDHFIFSSRLSFFKNTFNMFMDSSIYQKLFGIGYTYAKQIKISEMDYLDTFIHQGILGFIVIYFTYFKTIYFIFIKYLHNFKSNFLNIKKTSMIISIVVSMLCAFFTGHVLSTPAVSIFVLLVLLLSYNSIYEGDKEK